MRRKKGTRLRRKEEEVERESWWRCVRNREKGSERGKRSLGLQDGSRVQTLLSGHLPFLLTIQFCWICETIHNEATYMNKRLMPTST